MSTDDFIVTPWHVEGDIDYDKLIKKFGTEKISTDILEKIKKITNKIPTMPQATFVAYFGNFIFVHPQSFATRTIRTINTNVATMLSTRLSVGPMSVAKLFLPQITL